MVMIGQMCWNEMNINDELTLLCEDEACRGYEGHLRRTLYERSSPNIGRVTWLANDTKTCWPARI